MQCCKSNWTEPAPGANGLTIQVSGDLATTTVRGLVINRFSGDGIQVFGGPSTGIVIAGNFIGTDAAGALDRGNISAGVRVLDAVGVRIGGTTPAARNVISGNNAGGVYLVRGGGHFVEGNLIGTNRDGTAAVTNHFGIAIQSSGNTVGGSSTAARNVISGNEYGGIVITQSNSNGNVVQNNVIGLQVDGISPLGNGFNADPNDRRAGVGIEGTGNAIRSNSIAFNNGLGISLGLNPNIMPNDVGDADGGANNRQNFPVLSSVTVASGNTTITGTLNSTPNTTFRLELFASPAADPAGFGEGGNLPRLHEHNHRRRRQRVVHC